MTELQSMTGFGQAEGRMQGFLLQVEARSVNHRYLEMKIHMPREWQRHEGVIKEVFQRLFARGRIEIYVTVEPDVQTSGTVDIDWSLAEAYVEVSNQLKDRFQLSGTLTLSDFLQFPGVVMRHDILKPEDDSLVDKLGQISRMAAKQLLEMRSKEGHHLQTELMSLLKQLKRLHQQMLEAAPDVQRMLYERLALRLEELLHNVSLEPGRLHAEAAVLADRADIQEELTRLKSHLTQAQTLLENGGTIGRKLDFLSQEMNREANTMGAKASSEGLSKDVVELKSLIEKFREQVQNIQ